VISSRPIPDVTLFFRTDKVFPEWRANSEFINEHLNPALSLDAKTSSHPIEVDCPDANHINQVRKKFILIAP